MEKHFQFTDDEFVQQFDLCLLDPNDFTHEAHLRLAWIFINKHGIKKSEEIMHDQLMKFVDFAGVRDKYNMTVTIAAMKIVHHFMKKSKALNFKDFILEFEQLKHGFKDLIGAHYSIDVFNLEKAKTIFLEPDLMPFDE